MKNIKFVGDFDMNILADKQKLLYEDGITKEEYKKREEEFLKLYYDLRNKDERSILNRLTLEQRRKLHFLILSIYKLKNKIGGFSYDLLKDERTLTDRPIIFVVTHVGKFDIEVTSEAIKEHYYLLSGDYEHIQGIMDSSFLSLNGVYYFNEKVKEDRKSVSSKMINHLNNGGNLMYFIEGTWNLSPNLPVLQCYWGIVDIAKMGNAIIIPVAAEQYDKNFKVNIGKNFDMNNYGEGNENKSTAISDLRDTLATLKWEIWESEPIIKRSQLKGDEWEIYKKERLEEWPYFTEKYIDGLIYRPKDVVQHDDVYEPIKKILPNKKNAFIYDKRLHDDIFND